MRILATLLLGLAILTGLAPGALAESQLEQLEAREDELTRAVREGRLSKDDLVKREDELSYFTKMKLYLYAKELEPYFEGVEDSFRDIARADFRDWQGIDRLRSASVETMRTAWHKLGTSGRDDPERDWRRGLAGLIFLDQDWRSRVYEQGKDEIKNPYDLVRFLDCVDARMRGLEQGDCGQCPATVEVPPGWSGRPKAHAEKGG